jgi:hypothetical protein
LIAADFEDADKPAAGVPFFHDRPQDFSISPLGETKYGKQQRRFDTGTTNLGGFPRHLGTGLQLQGAGVCSRRETIASVDPMLLMMRFAF